MDRQDEKDSGPVEEFEAGLRESLAGGSFVKVTLGKRRGGDPTLKNVYARRVRVKEADALSLTFRHETRDVTHNYPLEEGVAEVVRLLGEQFLSAHLFTTAQDLRLEFNRRREPRLTRSRPTFDAPPPPEHDRRKRRFVDPSAPYLRALGQQADKFRQVNRFVEIVSHLYAASRLKGRASVSVVDVGAGKGYLTFALYDYLANTLGLKTEVVGVEARGELVELANRVARECGYEGLRFEAGLIGDYELGRADVLIALHACDTATDEAIRKGVGAGAELIVTAPCCHKELRPQIAAPEVLGGMLRHGIMLERQAEMLTDTLRALLLEAAGYQARVFEFVSTEHTRKNTMIAGVRREPVRPRAEVLREIDALKKFYGVREQSLECLLG